MKIEISGLHVPITEDIDRFVRKKIQKLDKYLTDIITVHMIIKSEKTRFETEINAVTKGSVINAKETEIDLYASIEGAIKKVLRQSKKYKEKKKNHKSPKYKEITELSQQDPVNAEAIDKKPAILRVKKELAKPMEIEEALMQLQESKDKFLIFFNAETNQINAIYEAKNESFILLEPS